MDDFLKAYGVQKNGNGVYVINRSGNLFVVVVWGEGQVDCTLELPNKEVAYNDTLIHSATTKMLVKRAYKFIHKESKF